MMKLLIFLSFFLFGTCLNAQIGTTKIPVKQEEPAQYDSTKNFLGEEYRQYIGQEFYLKGLNAELRKYGYRDLLTDYKKKSYQGGAYKCCSEESKYNTKYEAVSGKYFTVIDVVDDQSVSSISVFLKLQEKESKDILYFEYKPTFSEIFFPFIVVGYFEKLKQTCAGEKFVFADEIFKDKLDLLSGQAVSFSTGEPWKCVDITIEENYYELSYLIENEKNVQTTVAVNYSPGKMYTLEKANEYKAKFNQENWQKILQGKVKIGMTKEMCELSWGAPKTINKTTTANGSSEQWVYKENYLYFENGVLTTIQ